MAARKKVDPIKQREKRAKIAAIGGVVLLLAVAAWQGPKMMKLMNQKPVVPATSAAPAGTSALPGTGVAAVAAGTTASGELADTDVPPAALDDGQLVAFDVFETKDPFRPQVTNADLAASDGSSAATQDAAGAASGSSATPTTTTAASKPPTATTTMTAVPATSGPSETTTTSTTAKPAAPTVVISVNGVSSHVASGGTFPSGTPVFRLVSWTRGKARIGIVGGSYSTGDPTLELTLEQPVTLQNTSTGQRYKLILLSTP
jgi:hypothetical protein